MVLDLTLEDKKNDISLFLDRESVALVNTNINTLLDNIAQSYPDIQGKTSCISAYNLV